MQKGAPEAAAILRQVKDAEAQGYEYEAAEGSFELLVRKALGLYKPLFELKEFHCNFRRAGKGESSTCEATVKLLVDGVAEYTVAEGDGPVNALDAALRKALRPFYAWIDDIRLADYKVRIVDGMRARQPAPAYLSSPRMASRPGVRSVFRTISSRRVGMPLVDSIEYLGSRRAESR